MTRKQVSIIVLIAFFVGGVGSVFLTRLAFPYLSMVPGLSFLGKLQSDAPIMVIRREQVQLNEGVNLIELTKQSQNFTVSFYSGADTTLRLLGNGVIMSSDGLIFTTKEVVGNLTEFTVVVNDGASYPGVLRALDPKSELAIVTIPANNLAIAQLADASALQTGQRIFALGKTSHEFTRLFASGLIMKTVSNSLQPNKIYSTEVFEDAIVTDADINGDFAGGPVINLEGRVVGLVGANTRIIISEIAQGALSAYLADKKVIRPYLGFRYQNVSKHVSSVKQATDSGALVFDIESNSPAATGGLAKGDLILEANNIELTNNNLEEVIAKLRGDLNLVVMRLGQRVEITIKPVMR